MPKFALSALVFLIFLAGTAAAQKPLDRSTAEVSPKLDLISRSIEDCSAKANRFKRTLEADDILSRDASRLEGELNQASESLNRTQTLPKARSHVEAAIGIAQRIDGAGEEWTALREALDTLASQFSLPRPRWAN